MLDRLRFENFTAFDDLEINLSPGINVFIGENGAGKTHVLKAAYAACDIVRDGGDFADKVTRVFFPSGEKPGRLVRRAVGRGRSGAGSAASGRRRDGNAGSAAPNPRGNGSAGSAAPNRRGDGSAGLEVTRRLDNGKRATLQLEVAARGAPTVSGDTKAWMANDMEAVYIPAKDLLANAPGFQALHERRDLHFDALGVDIIRKATLPAVNAPPDKARKPLLRALQKAMSGKVVVKNDEFFLRNGRGELEFTLLAEGYRKLGLLWLLIQNHALLRGALLCWDEPEANLNPNMMQIVVGTLLALQRLGVQVLIATHDRMVLGEFEVQVRDEDDLQFHSLYRAGESGQIAMASTPEFLRIRHNPSDDAYASLIDRHIKKLRRGAGK